MVNAFHLSAFTKTAMRARNYHGNTREWGGAIQLTAGKRQAKEFH